MQRDSCTATNEIFKLFFHYSSSIKEQAPDSYIYKIRQTIPKSHNHQHKPIRVQQPVQAPTGSTTGEQAQSLPAVVSTSFSPYGFVGIGIIKRMASSWRLLHSIS
jgi:hypothetical protein